MNTSPAKRPAPGVVTFTARGDVALDQLAASLTAQCDGSPASVADVLKQVLEADVEQLAGALSETTAGNCERQASDGGEIAESDLAPPIGHSDGTAELRLGARQEHAAALPNPPRSIGR